MPPAPALHSLHSNGLCRRQMVEMEATNAELEDNNTRLEAAAMKADQQGAELASLQAALKAREQQHLALKVRMQLRHLFPMTMTLT